MLLGAWPLGGKSNHGSTTATSTKSGKFRFTLLCGGYILFLVVGAAIFSAIEAPRLDEFSKKLNLARSNFLKKYPCVDGEYFYFPFYCDITTPSTPHLDYFFSGAWELLTNLRGRIIQVSGQWEQQTFSSVTLFCLINHDCRKWEKQCRTLGNVTMNGSILLIYLVKLFIKDSSGYLWKNLSRVRKYLHTSCTCT